MKNDLLISELTAKVKDFTDKIMNQHKDIVIFFDVCDSNELYNENKKKEGNL